MLNFIEAIIFSTLSIFGIIAEIKDNSIHNRFKSEKELLLQNLHDKIKSENRIHLVEEIQDLMFRIGYNDLSNIFGFKIKNIITIKLFNNIWCIEIINNKIETSIVIEDLQNKMVFFFGKPNVNIEIKERFLKFFRDCCKKHKIKIRD